MVEMTSGPADVPDEDILADMQVCTFIILATLSIVVPTCLFKIIIII